MVKIIIFILVLTILISGCATFEEEVTTTVPTTTTLEEGVTITLEPKTFECEEKLTRRYYKEDGTFEEICIEPETLGLERCSSNDDCSEIEECEKGFCELIYSLVIDET